MADFARRHAKSKDEKMSLLETFFLKFQSDGLKEISAETEGTTQKADKMGNSFVQNGKKIVQVLAPVVGLAALINRTMNFASSAEEMSYLAQNTGLAAEKFQALAIAAENYGGSAEGIAGSIQGLNTNLQNMKFGKGGGGVEDAAIAYGINLYGKNGLATADELLMNVAERFESLDSMQQLDLGQRLGLDEGTIRLLQTGVENVQNELEHGRKYSLFTKEDIENSRKFQRTMRDIKLGLAQIFGVVARSLLPAFTWLGEKIKSAIDIVKDHSGFILGFLAAVAAALTVLAIKSGLAFLPFIGAVALITAVSTAIGLLIDDIVNFWQGNESLIGAFVDAVKVVFTALWDWMTGKTLLKWGKKLLNGDKGETPKVDMADAQRKLAQTQTPWASVPQGSVSTSYANTSQSVRVDNVTINTQATDAQGIAADLNTQIQELFMSTAKAHTTSRIS